MQEDYQVEWHSGKDARTYPKRIKVKGIWREVFSFEKEIREDISTRRRIVIFYCDIGDNEIIKVKETL